MWAYFIWSTYYKERTSSVPSGTGLNPIPNLVCVWHTPPWNFYVLEKSLKKNLKLKKYFVKNFFEKKGSACYSLKPDSFVYSFIWVLFEVRERGISVSQCTPFVIWSSFIIWCTIFPIIWFNTAYIYSVIDKRLFFICNSSIDMVLDYLIRTMLWYC